MQPNLPVHRTSSPHQHIDNINQTNTHAASKLKARRSFWLLLLLFTTAVAGLMSTSRQVLYDSNPARTLLLDNNPIKQHTTPLYPLSEHAADEQLLRMLAEECSKGQETVILLDDNRHMRVQQHIDQLQPCPAMDIMLRGSERGIGMCTDAMLYVLHAGARLIPWQENQQVYDALCPHNARLFLETMYESFISSQPGVLHLMLPNSEHMWVRDQHLHAKMQVFLCKTRLCLITLRQHLSQMGYQRARVWFMGHTSSDPSEGTAVKKQPATFLHIKGKSGLKHTTQLLQCWASRPDLPTLTVVGRFSWPEVEASVSANNIVFYPSVTANYTTNQTELISFQQIRQFQLESAVHVCPSEREGFGHYINEARASGAFIISTDHPPMNELVPAKIGLLISPDRTTSYDDMALGRYYPINAFMGPEAICKAIDTVLRLPALEIVKKGQAARTMYLQEKAAFVARMKDLREFLLHHQQQQAEQLSNQEQQRRQQQQQHLR